MPAGAFFLIKKDTFLKIVVSRKRGTTFLGKVSFRVYRATFFDFFRDVSDESVGFESISGKHSSNNYLNTCVLVRGIPQKVNKNIARERHKITKYRCLHRICSIWHSSGTAPAALEVVSSTAARTLRNHAPGARMTVVYLKQTNSLKLHNPLLKRIEVRGLMRINTIFYPFSSRSPNRPNK